MDLRFNDKFLANMYLPVDNVFTPVKQDESLVGYQDALTGEETTLTREYILFVPESFITIMNKLSQKIWDESNLGNDVTHYKKLITTLVCGNITQRDKAISKIVNDGLITELEVIGTRALTSGINGFDPDFIVKRPNLETGDMDYEYNNTIELRKPYDVVNNAGNENIYLFFPVRFSQNIGGKTIGVEVTSWTTDFKSTETTVAEDISYIAVELGDLMSTNDPDLRFDHTDKIDYIDNFKIAMNIPNQSSN